MSNGVVGGHGGHHGHHGHHLGAWFIFFFLIRHMPRWVIPVLILILLMGV